MGGVSISKIVTLNEKCESIFLSFLTMAIYPRYLPHRFMVSILMFFSCTHTDYKVAADALRKETYHHFSNTGNKDHFDLHFVCSQCEADSQEYTNSDILSGGLELSIYSNDNKNVFTHRWSVSDCFSMADNHYMSEAQKVEKFLYTVDHFFDSTKFTGIQELKITGILKSADLPLRRDIEADTNSIGFSFIQEDFCVIYSKTFQQAVLLRALRKDLLRKYDLL
jgi:hypothetical protein